MLKNLSIIFLIGLFAVSAFPQKPIKIKAEVWADNWFTFYLGEKFIKEDSVPITTERSFNAETFTFEAEFPLTLNFVAKDFIENDTGFEYIGTRRQQLGDGGLIAQFTNADTGELIAVTNSDWKCLVVHNAPLDENCSKVSNPKAGEKPCEFIKAEEPKDWKSPKFDDSKWEKATVYFVSEVRPKDGYDRITWNPSAKFIWGPDLRKNNTILCRLNVANSKKQEKK